MVEKKTGTYADALEAVGWGTLMEELGVRRVKIRDFGTRFHVEGEGDPEPGIPVNSGFCFVADAKNDAPNGADWVLDYDAERAKEEAKREFDKATKKKSKKVAAAGENGDLAIPDPPRPELRLAKLISSMRKGWNGDRELAHWLSGHPSEGRAWIEAAIEGRSFLRGPELSNTQLLNPSTGKGVNAAKTQAKSPGSIPNALVDAFSEWMKLRGAWRSMIAYRSDEDFKFMVLEPGDISMEGMKTVHSALDGLNLWGGVRLDIESTLKCTSILIEKSDENRISLFGRRPRQVIRGLRQAFFKSLGTAAALMNEALLPLPGWFVVRNRDDAAAYIDIIVETVGENEKVRGGCLGVLDEVKSDEGGVLQQYRSWLGSGDFEELMEFHRAYGALMTRKSASGEYTRLFRTEILDELLIRTYGETEMLTEIVKNNGFKSVARAIRNTTVYAVGMKNSNREPQFGLAQRWKQKMKAGAGEFSSELAEFVQTNNWEVTHSLKGRGHQVTTEDLDQIVELIEKHGETKVGSLLLAYGYSRAPKVEDDSAATEETKG